MIRYNKYNVNEEELDSRYNRLDKTEYFDFSPRIVETKKNVKIKVESRYPQLINEGVYSVLISPYLEYDFIPEVDNADTILQTAAKDGVIEFEYKFEKEQLYRIAVGQVVGNDVHVLIRGDLYALDTDLYGLNPYIGELHCHTIFSDGFETPDMVIDAAKDIGFDFIAITDHNSFEGSVEGIKRNTTELIVLHGEEYSSNFTNMHIISLGAKQALPEEKYILDKKTIEENSCVQLTKNLVNEIKLNGGVSIMCHPLWKPMGLNKRMDVPYSTVCDLLNDNPFDAVEIVSGSLDGDIMTTIMQHNIAIEHGATPDKIAYIGITDSHRYHTDPICGRHFTMIFCKENTEDAILDAIRKKRTVAIQLVDNENAMCFGQTRYCMYANFLLKYKYKKIK